MNKYRFSVIVPVYNVESYLDRCMESLLTQENAEIILVDDGSTDRSGEICDRYAEKYPNVRVLHQKNAGLSAARNAGTAMAEGQYILFVDSDDYIEQDTCRQMQQTLMRHGEVDILAFNGWEETSSVKEMLRKPCEEPKKALNGKQYLLEHFQKRNMNVEACLHAFRKEFLADNELRFKEGILHEDVEFTPRAFLKATKVLEMPNAFYHYIIRGNSISTQKDKTKNIVDLFDTLYAHTSLAEEQEPELRKWMKNWILDSYLNMVQDAGMYQKKYRRLLDKRFLPGKAATAWNHFRVGLCMVNVRLYYWCNVSFKRIRRCRSNR